MNNYWRVIGHVAIFILVLVAGVRLCLAIFGNLIPVPWLSAPLISFSDGSSLPAGTAASVILALLAATAAVIWRLRPQTGRPHWIGLGIATAILFAAFGAKLAFAPGSASQQIAGSVGKPEPTDLVLALVKDDPGNASMSPVFDASGSGQTYIPIRDLTKSGEIESVTPDVDQNGNKMLRVHLTDAAGSRLASDKSIPGQEVALELGSVVLASATVQTNFGADFDISGLTESDVTRILAAISSDLFATRIPKVATAPKWIILDRDAKFLSKSVFVSASTGLIHLTYCSTEPCNPPDDNVDVNPATIDCKSETFSWTNGMELPMTDSLQGKNPAARNSEDGILIEGLCSQKGSLPVHP